MGFLCAPCSYRPADLAAVKPRRPGIKKRSTWHAAARRAAEFLLARRLLWRSHDGALIVPEWGGPVDKVHYPIRFYDVLTALLVMTELGVVRDACCADALDLLEAKRLGDGTFPVGWTNARTTDRAVSRGTYADWGPRGWTRGNPFVTIDALYVPGEAGRDWR